MGSGAQDRPHCVPKTDSTGPTGTTTDKFGVRERPRWTRDRSSHKSGLRPPTLASKSAPVGPKTAQVGPKTVQFGLTAAQVGVKAAQVTYELKSLRAPKFTKTGPYMIHLATDPLDDRTHKRR